MSQGILKIGNKTYPSPVVLAPMAGVTDAPFRAIVRMFGDELVFSEMLLADSLAHGHGRTEKMASVSRGESPVAVQLAGMNPEMFALAAQKIERDGAADFIDVNMGCPVPKITRSGAGSALMDDEETAQNIVRALVKATSLPVTVKFRLGRDADHRNFLDFGKRMRDAGAAAVTLHARTRDMMYSGEADRDAIRRLKEALDIPVIANGDVSTPEDALRILEDTGADGVMIGRGALGRPFILSRCTAKITGAKEKKYPEPITIILEHLRLLEECYGKRKAVFVARKHLAWYSSGMTGGAAFRSEINRISDPAEVKRLVFQFFKESSVK